MLVCFSHSFFFKIYLSLNAGTLVGITNTMASVPGFVAPYVVGAITYNNVRIFSLSDERLY
jgi:hypothetical protein